MRVNVDGIAFTDDRFDRLAMLLGLADADHARGKVSWLWLACTTRGEVELPQWLVEKHLGPKGPPALVEVGLARWAGGRGDSDTRRMYICGAKGRTEWHERKQEQSVKGGKSRARTASRAGGRFTSQNTSPPAPAPALKEERETPLSADPTDSDTLREKVDSAAKNRSPRYRLPPDWKPDMELEPNQKLARTAPKLGVDLALELEKIHDWARSSVERKADWNAFWRNWIRREMSRPKPANNYGRDPITPRKLEVL